MIAARPARWASKWWSKTMAHGKRFKKAYEDIDRDKTLSARRGGEARQGAPRRSSTRPSRSR